MARRQRVHLSLPQETIDRIDRLVSDRFPQYRDRVTTIETLLLTSLDSWERDAKPGPEDFE